MKTPEFIQMRDLLDFDGLAALGRPLSEPPSQ
jgi:hypothetical protein